MGVRTVNDRIFQQLAANYPEHMVWEFNLRNMWAEVDDIFKEQS